MNKRRYRWRVMVAFILAFHFILTAPAQAVVTLPKTLHMRAEKPLRFISGWGVKYIGRYRAEFYGWNSKQFVCLDRLWTQESHWNFRARNSYSGAYGIPQALPGNKMDVVATDWRVSPTTQIVWGLRYIKIRYGSPCKALRHEFSTGYY